MFQFSGLALFRVIRLQRTGLSHSEIFGLTVVCTYPKLIAAYHVLLRLSMPRHPPYALIRFKYCYSSPGPKSRDITPCFLSLHPRGCNASTTNQYCYRFIDYKNCFPNMSKNFINVQMRKCANMQIETVMFKDLNLLCSLYCNIFKSLLPLLFPSTPHLLIS